MDFSLNGTESTRNKAFQTNCSYPYEIMKNDVQNKLINSTWLVDLKQKNKVIKLLKKEYLYDLRAGQDCLINTHKKIIRKYC